MAIWACVWCESSTWVLLKAVVCLWLAGWPAVPVTSCVCAHGTGIYFQVCCWLNLQMSSAMSLSLGRGLGSWALGWAPAARQEVSWARAAGGGGPALNTSLGIKEANPVTMLFYYLVLLIPLGKKKKKKITPFYVLSSPSSNAWKDFEAHEFSRCSLDFSCRWGSRMVFFSLTCSCNLWLKDTI